MNKLLQPFVVVVCFLMGDTVLASDTNILNGTISLLLKIFIYKRS